jgi:hypothetical protein
MNKSYVERASDIVEEINKKLQELKDLTKIHGSSFTFNLDVNDLGVAAPYSDSKQEVNTFIVGMETDWGTSEETVVISQWFPSNMSC